MLARHRLEWVTAVLAAVLGCVYLAFPKMGSDLAAQTARAEFFVAHGYTPIDLRWYAGVDQLGYSLVSQPVMALLGVRVAGVVAVVVGGWLFAALLSRTGAPRPWLGAVAGVVCILGNLISGRVTYGIGVCFALAALLTLTYPRRRWLAAVAALLAGATSPVAGLFVGLAGVALMLGRRYREGLLIAVPAAVPVIVSGLLFGDGGWMNISHNDTIHAVVSALLVALLLPYRPARVGALLAAAGVLAATLIHTPVGLNATRLPVMFTIPLLAAYATLPRRLRRPRTAPPVDTDMTPAVVDPVIDDALAGRSQPVSVNASAGTVRPASASISAIHLRLIHFCEVMVLLVVAWYIEPPINSADVKDIGNSSAQRSYFAPLLAQLAQHQLTGRVEVPATQDYWEAAYLGDIPLARGWLRQADIDRNPLFFDKIPGATGTGVPLNVTTYKSWLADLSVQFVAVPDTPLTWNGRPEATLVTAGLPYLTLIWRSAHWRLYAVADPQPIVAAPATLIKQTAVAVTIQAPAAGDIAVRVRYHRWLHASGGATVTTNGVWTVLHAPQPGQYTLSS